MVSTLIIFGCPSWREWVEPILAQGSRPADYVFDKDLSDGAVDRLVRLAAHHEAQQVILVSHHDTLHRDFHIGEALLLRTGKTCIFQPKHVCDLATDKRLMSEYTAQIAGLSQIEEFPFQTVADSLEDGGHPVVAKHVGLTEGLEFRVLSTAKECDQFRDDQAGHLENFLFQPFVQGLEFSVNAVTAGNRISIFQPISKSRNTSSGWDHPCKRRRKCPDPAIGPRLIERLVEMSASYVRALGAQGLVELEFVVADDGTIWFLEINPRLSATTRMVSIVSEIDVFSKLIDLIEQPESAATEVVRTLRFSEEFPIPRDVDRKQLATQFLFPEFSFSSRATITGQTKADLDQNILMLQDFLNDSS